MTTLVLSAAGAAIGGAVGGSVLGLSSVAVGRFAGAMIGNAIDQRVLGSGGAAVETGRIDRYRFTGSAEGKAIAQVYGRMRIAGHVIWATRFKETVTTAGGGKGAPSAPQRRDYSYSVSLALALCEGEITGVTRLWADGREISMHDVMMRVYPGSEDQLPDPKIEAVEGAGTVPAYRGTAYVVFEDLDLAPFGNRVPQFSFEVSRPAPITQAEASIEPIRATKAVALMPGTGEYALATEPVYYQNGPGRQWPANVNSPSGQADFVTAFSTLETELPNCEAVSLIVSWFGDDLRCGECDIRPKVESAEFDGSMPWGVAGLTRAEAGVVPSDGDRPIYGGTPADQAVMQAISHMKAAGKAVMYYPFVLMEQMESNTLPDPWSDEPRQPTLPWRGRITLSKAPGQSGSPDRSELAEQEVAAFFGTASAADFTVSEGNVTYSGPEEWRYRRFILHQAALCKAAGGVESFCIGSEMRSLTAVRGDGDRFVAVEALIDLLHEVRLILGEDVKLSYAADWSEYFGLQPEDGTGNRYFHLDALWADDDLDFIGIDNYMPLSDWREGDDHADAEQKSIYNLDYLDANIEGGEGFDWYYHSDEARDAQIRTPIEDGAYGEPWVFRYKDIRRWWANSHFERIDGIRRSEPTAWEPQSKPIRFTELGCAAIDKGSNQPNKFLDPKSSESTLPAYSNGQPDEFIQMQYLKAQYRHWSTEAHNPVSSVYGSPMIDMSRAYVWAWDARPYPRFPRNLDLWSDGENYRRGHWISGRTTHRSLASVVEEICDRAGLAAFDVSALEGVVRGYSVDQVTDPRKALQPLMLRYGFDAVEREGVLTFVMRGRAQVASVSEDEIAVTHDLPLGLEHVRSSEAEMIGRVRLDAVEANGDFRAFSEEAVFADDTSDVVSASELNLVMQRGEARQTAERWLAEARLGKDRVRFALPISKLSVRVGEVVSLPVGEGKTQTYRIDRVEIGEALQCEAVRVETSVYEPRDLQLSEGGLSAFSTPVPLLPLFMDLPLITGEETPHAPHLVTVADSWVGPAAVYSSVTGHDFKLTQLLTQRARVGVLETDLLPCGSGVWDRGNPIQVRLLNGTLESVSTDAVLSGANLAIVGDGDPDHWEIIQFEKAELSGKNTYQVSNRLRGQRGSNSQTLWPAGSWFVVMDQAVEQLDIPATTQGLPQIYRVGPASRPVSDGIYVEESHAFKGNGLKPLSPVHLRTTLGADGQIDLTWVRQTRLGGNNWQVHEVPLGEETEAYQVELWSDGDRIQDWITNSPEWHLGAAELAGFELSGIVELRVAQLSAVYGAGSWAKTHVTLP